MNGTKTCSIDGCEKRHYGRGWCKMHYERWRNHGDPLLTLMAPRGAGHITKAGYRVLWINERFIFEHRHVMASALGRSLQRSEHVHHRNGDTLDNRFDNLQLVSNAEHRRLHRDLRTCCKQGHPWDEANTRWYRGKRNCRACQREWDRNRFKSGSKVLVANLDA